MKPKNFSQAIDELEGHDRDNGSEPGGDFKARLEREIHKMQETLENLKPQLDQLGDRARTEAKKAKDRVEKEVTDNPWAALGIVGLIFFVLGFVLGIKGSRRGD